MFPRYLMICAAVLALTACSKTDKSEVNTENDTGMMASGENMAGAPVPGSQEDLTVNVGDRVLFDTDSSDVSQQGRSVLEHQAAWLAQYSNVNILIEGHADERGTREYNLALGERRANSVKSYLQTLGVDASRLSTVSYGKERPAVEGSDESAWSQNRRGVAVVQ